MPSRLHHTKVAITLLLPTAILLGGMIVMSSSFDVVPMAIGLASCGNGICDQGENCALCFQDCSAQCSSSSTSTSSSSSSSSSTSSSSSSTSPSCGDSICQAAETCTVCPQDCGACPIVCGDGTCNGTESCNTCTSDCGTCPPMCGDGACNGTEACSSCAQDCGACPAVCGDGACNGAEECATCSADCGTCPPACGDDVCNGAETCVGCPGDCGVCSPTCNDRVCNGTETCQTCSSDCGACPAACGDGACNGAETCTTCAADCGNCPESCGDGTCGFGESCSSCPAECGACPPRCGDGSCNRTETHASCAADCGAPPAFCGNNACDAGETCSSCPGDCNACPSQCGDDSCNGEESCSSCAADCGRCPAECGNSVCTAREESCTSCSVDCGVCAPRCGDGMCLGEESCANCTGDCGECVTLVDGSVASKVPPSPVPAQSGEEIARMFCPNEVCDVWEECTICPDDCGPCPRAMSSLEPQPSLLNMQRLFRMPDVEQVFPRLEKFFTRFLRPVSDAEAFREKARELLAFLRAEENRSLSEHLTSLQRRWLQSVMEKTEPRLHDRVMAKRVARTLERGLEAEAQEVGKSLYELFSISTVRSLFWSWPGFNPLLRAAFDADLPAVLRSLPQPTQDLPALALKLTEIGNVLGKTVSDGTIPPVFASKGTVDPEEALHVSLSMLQEVKSIAAQPEDALPHVEETLTALREKAVTLAASAALPVEEVEQTLEDARKGAQARSVPAMISVLRSLRSLASSLDPLRRERDFRTALSTMRTGFGSLRASLVADTPEAEAADLLAEKLGPEAPAALQGQDVALQRETLLAFLSSALEELDPLLDRLSEGERRTFDARILAWQAVSLHGAETPIDVREAFQLLREIIADAERTARAHSPLFLRMFYHVQDLLALTS